MSTTAGNGCQCLEVVVRGCAWCACLLEGRIVDCVTVAGRGGGPAVAAIAESRHWATRAHRSPTSLCVCAFYLVGRCTFFFVSSNKTFNAARTLTGQLD